MHIKFEYILISILVGFWLQIGTQNAPQRPQNTSKIDPKSTQNCRSTLGPPGGTKILFCRIWIDFGAQFGPPWDPKIDQKSILCEKNAQRSALSNQCLPGAAHHLIFYTFLGSFLVKKRSKKKMRQQMVSRRPLDPHGEAHGSPRF